MWPWNKSVSRSLRHVFTLQDDDKIASLRHADAADVFDDIFSGRDLANEETGTYVGNALALGRQRLGMGIVLCALAIFLGRVFLWQILQGSEYRALADANRTSTVILPANRGVIKDRSGIVLAWNEPSFQLIATPNELPSDPAQRDALFERAAVLLQLENSVDWIGKDDAAVLLSEDVAYEQALAFMTQTTSWPGLRIELGARRAYVTDAIPTLSHVLGYTGAIADDEYAEVKDSGYRRFDSLGKLGLEKYYESLLP